MNKKSIALLVGIYVFFYIFNLFTPLSFGDDYVYSFIWQGHSIYEPLTEPAIRVSSLRDLILSQWEHYFTWSGRVISHLLAQLFLWVGKERFNYFNAFVATMLIVEISWCIDKGRISNKFSFRTLCWVFFAVWAFVPGIGGTFFWLTGACNYLCTTTILLGFSLPYVHKYYYNLKEMAIPSSVMFFGGIIAGWTNENSVCFVILTLGVFLYKKRKELLQERWLYFGLAGLILGYTLLILSPGNVLRLQVERTSTVWINTDIIIEHLKMLLTIGVFQLFLWYFSLRSIYTINVNDCNQKNTAEFLLSRAFLINAFLMSAIMIFSPGFPARSGTPGTICLIIAVGTLFRMQDEYNVLLIQNTAKKFLISVGIIFFVMITGTGLYNFYETNKEMENLLSVINEAKKTNKYEVITVQAFKEFSVKRKLLSGWHILIFELSDNEHDWKNVAFARYYAIKGIRMVKDESTTTTLNNATVSQFH